MTQNQRSESIPKTIVRISWISEYLMVSVVVGLCFLYSMDGKGTFPYQLWPTELGRFLRDNTWGKVRSFPVSAQLDTFFPWFCFPVIFPHSFTSLSEFCILLPYLANAALQDLRAPPLFSKIRRDPNFCSFPGI